MRISSDKAKDFWHYVSSVQLLSRVWLFATPWTIACQASLYITNSQSLLKLLSIKSVMPSNHFIPCCCLLLPSIFLSITVFSNESVLHIKWSIGPWASVLVLPMNIQNWFLLGLTGWISLQSKGLSRVLSNITVQKHQFLGTQLSLWSNSHIHTRLLEKPQLWQERTLSAKLFNMLSRLVIAFLLRSKHLLISWLQSLSAVIFSTQLMLLENYIFVFLTTHISYLHSPFFLQ